MLFPQMLWRNERPCTHEHRSETRVGFAFEELIFDIDKINGALLKFSNPCTAVPKEDRIQNFFQVEKVVRECKAHAL